MPTQITALEPHETAACSARLLVISDSRKYDDGHSEGAAGRLIQHSGIKGDELGAHSGVEFFRQREVDTVGRPTAPESSPNFLGPFYEALVPRRRRMYLSHQPH